MISSEGEQWGRYEALSSESKAISPKRNVLQHRIHFLLGRVWPQWINVKMDFKMEL